MSVQNQPRLNFEGVDVHSVHVDVENTYYNNSEVEHVIIPKIVLSRKKPDTFRVLMDINLKSEGFFKITALLSGTFTLNMEAEDEHRNIFMNQNAPAILFPYVRSFISTLTANLGSTTGTIIIPPQVFKGQIDVSIEEDNSVGDNFLN